jgi:hypothetical protein
LAPLAEPVENKQAAKPFTVTKDMLRLQELPLDLVAAPFTPSGSSLEGPGRRQPGVRRYNADTYNCGGSSKPDGYRERLKEDSICDRFRVAI